jgi:ligand-binding sensor domain-containing protein
MKKNSPSPASLCAMVILVTALALVPGYAGTILRQFASFKAVNAIVKNGNMLWLATSGGVVRYDNTSAAGKIYTEMSDLPDLNLAAAVQDASGDIWFGSADGYLVKLHPKTETFTSYNALAATGWNIKCMSRISDYLLIGTNKGLGIFSIREKIFQNVKKFNTFSSVDVSAIHVFGDTIAIATADGIAYTNSNIQTTIFSDPGIWTTIPGPDVLGIISQSGALTASPNKIQQFGNDSVWKFGGPALFFNDQPVHTFPSPVTCMLPLGNSGYAVGTESSCWYLCNLSTASFNQVLINGPVASNISSCAVDQNGKLWFVPNDLINGIGTYDGKTWGVLTQDNTPGIGMLSTGPGQYKNAITLTTKNDLWISTYAFGVKWYNSAAASWASYEDSAAPGRGALTPIARFDNVIKDGVVLSWWSLMSGTCEDSLGNIWIANQKAYNAKILHVRKARDNNAWRSFNVADNNLKFISSYTSLVAANQNKLLNKQYIYLGYLKKEDFTGGGLSILTLAVTFVLLVTGKK